jgi:hypothetical protein
MGGDPRMMQAWIRTHHGDDFRAEQARINRGLRFERTARGPIDDTGPMVRLTSAWIRGDRQEAFQISRAIDVERGWYGHRLSREPERHDR